jgi:class 3 adenylate cyclase
MAAPPLPSGTVTFVFTDVEGSTQLLKRLGPAYGATLARHHEVVREALAGYGGHEVDTQGEAFFVAFPRAKDAVAAAVELQRSHASEPWRDGAAVRVRIGIHTAEPELSPTGYFGMGLHRAARICALGHGGQVLLSRSTAGLVDEDETPELALRDLGEHLLKDLERPERVYQLVAPGLDEDFPALGSVTEIARRAAAARLPRGTLTFLNVDIAGYSKTVRVLGVARVGAWLDTFDSIVNATIDKHDGHVLELSGDFALAVFARAGEAVAAAVELVAATEGGDWPEAPPVLQVGVYTGEAERWESQTRSGYLGTAVLGAFALCNIAAPGQVVLSAATAAVAGESTVQGIALRPLGERELPQFARPVALYEAVAEP